MKTKQSSRHGRAWPIVIGTAVALIAAAAISMTAAQASGRGPDTSDAKAARMQAERDEVRQLPQRHKPTVEQGRAAAAAVRPNSGDEVLTPGIVALHQGPFPATEFTVRNIYRAPVGGRWLFVFAGGTRDEQGNIKQGALRIFQQPDGGAYTEVGVYPTTGSQALTVASAKGAVLTLITDDGQTVTFDLANLTYGR